MKEKEIDKKSALKRASFRENKSSSTSSIFLDTTISSPTVKNMIKAVAILLKT